MCCAHAVRNVGYILPVPPDGPGDRGNYCFSIHRTAQIVTQSQSSDNESKQTMFRAENARLLLNLLFLLYGHMLPWWWVVFRVVTGS